MSETIQVPKGWEMKTLSQVCTINPSKSEIKDLSDDTLVSFIPMRNVDDKQGVIQTWGEEVLGKVRKGFTYFRNNDVIFAKITPCMENGKIAIGMDLKNDIGFASTEFHVLRPHDQILSGFIHYFLRNLSFRMEAKENFTGSAGQQRVPKDFLENHIIPVPPILIQKQIVTKLDHILGELDVKKKQILSLIEQNKERIDFFEKNWFLYILNKEIEPILLNCQKNQKDFYFDDLVNCCTDIIDTPHSTVPYQKSGIPVIRTSNLKPYQINFLNCKYTSKKTFEERRKKLDPKMGDILYAREAPWGISAQVKKEGFVVGQRILLLRPNLEKINSDFLDLILNSSFGYNQAKSVVNETTSGHVNIGDIKKFKIPVIPENEQTKIVQNIKNSEEKFKSQKKQFENIKNNYESKIKYINHIQSSILDSAFSGKLIQ
jgi:type I restriction enzyme, S subunit